MRRFLAAFLLIGALAQVSFAQDETYHFATKDGMDLLMDEYRPAKAKQTLDGKQKPTIIYVFGGGFKIGSRDTKSTIPWLEKLAAEGYRVFAIDYRLGLKDFTQSANLLNTARTTLRAVDLGVEDLFSATSYILDNAEMLGVDPKNIVISGSSAGAIISLQAEWEICNRSSKASVLPSDFNYAGVISFSGAILSNQGMPKFKNEPCPIFLIHGTKDKVVNYKKIRIFNWCFAGSSVLSNQFSRKKYNYSIMRFTDFGHEIAASMMYNFDEEIKFLEEYVIRGKSGRQDRTISDATMQHWGMFNSRKDIYGKR